MADEQTINIKSKQPMVIVLGYFDEDEVAHIPEKQKCIVDYLISSGISVPVEELQYNEGRLTSILILDPRRERGHIPVVLHTGDFRMVVFINV